MNDSFCRSTPPLLDTSGEPNEAGTSCSVLNPSVPGSGQTATGRDNSIYTAHPDTASLHNVASGDRDDRGLRGRHHQSFCCLPDGATSDLNDNSCDDNQRHQATLLFRWYAGGGPGAGVHSARRLRDLHL